MPSRESLDALWTQHNHKYASAETWEAAMKQALMVWAQPDRAQVRERLEKLFIANPGIKHLDEIVTAICGEARTGWCVHMVWGGEQTISGSWGVKGADPEFPRAINYSREVGFYQCCPLCGVPRPAAQP